MKIKYVFFILAASFCIAAPAWSDTMSPDDRNLDRWGQYSRPARFELSAPNFEYVSVFYFEKGLGVSDRAPFGVGDATPNSLAPSRFGEGWIVFDRFRKWDGGPSGAAGTPGNPPPSVPVPEPSTVALLAAGLVALFGTTLRRLPRGPRAAAVPS
jgi:PEP-CTERM motif